MLTRLIALIVAASPLVRAQDEPNVEPYIARSSDGAWAVRVDPEARVSTRGLGAFAKAHQLRVRGQAALKIFEHRGFGEGRDVVRLQHVICDGHERIGQLTHVIAHRSVERARQRGAYDATQR